MFDTVIEYVLKPILVIAVTFLIYKLIIGIIGRTKKLKNENIDEGRLLTVLSLIRSVVKYLFIIIDTVIILNIFGINTTAIVTSLGAVSLVVGLALQDILRDILSGFFIIVENQYEIGDFVEVGTFKGTVVSVGLRTTRLQAYTGEIKIISNRNIEAVTNFSKDKSLAIVDVCVAYDADLELVEKVLNNLLDRLSKELSYLKSPITLLGVNELASSSIKYRLVVDTEPIKHYEIQRILLKEIKLEFDKNNIEIPFDQLVIHND